MVPRCSHLGGVGSVDDHLSRSSMSMPSLSRSPTLPLVLERRIGSDADILDRGMVDTNDKLDERSPSRLDDTYR